MNRLRLVLSKSIQLTPNRMQVANYAKGANILRGRYYKKRLDGIRYEFNESINIVLPEFADQGLFVAF